MSRKALNAVPEGARARPGNTGLADRAAFRKNIGDWALPSLWAMSFRHLKGRPMQFYSKKDPFFHRPWQVAPTDDMSPTLVIQKGRQMGFTEIFITSMVYMSTLVRCRTIYTMPKERKAEEIARTRIMPVGEPHHPDAFHGEVLDRLQNGWRYVMHKAIFPKSGGGRSEILISGSFNEDLGESTAADRVFLDEYDRMKPGVISAFRECLSSSRLKHLRVFSTPTFPKVGVDGQYRNSDKRHWTYKCPKCGHWQFLTRENLVQRKGNTSLIQRLEAHDESANVPDGTFAIACLKCGNDLDRWNAKCEWVAETDQGEIRGYKASQLDCVWISADDIMRKLREYKPIGKWFNYVLAEGYLGDAGRLAENFIYQLVRPDLHFPNYQSFIKQHPDGKVVIGIDWGKTNWAMVLGITNDYQHPVLLEPFMFLDTDDPEDTVNAMVDLAKRWKATVVVADYGYGQDRNPKLYQRLPCQFWCCLYPTVNSAQSTSEPLFGPSTLGSTMRASQHPYPLVKIGRAPSIKERIIGLFAQQLIIPKLSALEQNLDVLDMHFRNVAIVLHELADGTNIEVAETTGPDHYLHCYNYAMIAIKWLVTHDLKVLELDQPNSVRDPRKAGGSIGVPAFDDVVDALDILDY